MKFAAFAFSACLHLAILGVLLYEFSDKTRDLGGMNAKKGEFQSIMLVSVPQNALKELSFNAKKSKKSEKSPKKADLKTKQNEQNANLRASADEISKQKDEKAQNELNSNLNAVQKDATQESPQNAENSQLQSPVVGTSNKTAKSYQAEVLSHLEGFKSYPIEALLNKMEGKVRVRVSLSENGEVKSVKIITKSGFSLLDNESMALFRRANPLPKPPAKLAKNGSVVFSLNLEYNIAKFYQNKK